MADENKTTENQEIVNDDIEIIDKKQIKKTKGDKKTPYRLLNIKERDLLFAFYEKWNGNVYAMIRDRGCPFRGKNQLYFYKHYYNFEERLVLVSSKRCEEINNALKENKSLVIQKAYEMIQSKQTVLRNPLTGEPILDKDGQPIFVEHRPSFKEIKTAWEIIKTELGEPTQIAKGDLTSGGKPIRANQITFKNFNGSDSK